MNLRLEIKELHVEFSTPNGDFCHLTGDEELGDYDFSQERGSRLGWYPKEHAPILQEICDRINFVSKLKRLEAYNPERLRKSL